MAQLHEPDRQGSKLRRCRATGPRPGVGDDLKRESEGKDDRGAEDPQCLPIAGVRNRHGKHQDHDREADQAEERDIEAAMEGLRLLDESKKDDGETEEEEDVLLDT